MRVLKQLGLKEEVLGSQKSHPHAPLQQLPEPAVK